jgi:hypothetical protein
MTTPFGLIDSQIFDEHADCPQLFLDRSLKFFGLFAEPLAAHNHALLLRGGR